MPLPLSSVVTSVNELVRSLIVYLDELLRYAVRATMICELGTIAQLSAPGFGVAECLFQLGPVPYPKLEPRQRTRSTISRNQTSTAQWSRSWKPALLWMSSLSLPCRILLAR